MTHGSDRPVDLRPVGIVDIGSNSVRLVVYRGRSRTPVQIFNEKSPCALGRGIASTGVLNPEGREQALRAIKRFVSMAQAMGVEFLDVVATAAVRDATDGPDFMDTIHRECHLKGIVLSGEEEAHTAALGVLCAVPEADGVVADLGGGSLELITVKDGRFGEVITLPFGVLRLHDRTGGDAHKARALVEEKIAPLEWLSALKGRTLYAVGGTWRALAKVYIDQRNYPLHVLDNFTLQHREAQALNQLISRQSLRSLEAIASVNRRRVPYVGMGAAVLDCLLQYCKPAEVVFSVYGMREGRFFAHLPEDIRTKDPLLAACSDLARSAGRFPAHGDELMDWMTPLFPDESARLARLRRAACLIGDMFWSEHPDHRAEQAFHRILKLPTMGLDHRDRAGLALAVYWRYSSDDPSGPMADAADLLDEDRVQRVRTIGYALRLGYEISGGAPGVVGRTALDLRKGRLNLHLPSDDPVYYAEAFDKRLDRLARLLGAEPSLASLE
ncbi:MAG: exopolyphosphatase [Rhodospirillaceae bacterium]